MLLTVASVQAQTPTTISVDVASSIDAGMDAHVGVELDPDINAIAKLTVTNSDNSYNETFYVPLDGGDGSYNVPNLAAGTYSITASFAGNEQYSGSTSAAKELQVSKVTTALALSLLEEAIYVGDFTNFIVELQNNNKQNISVNTVVTVRLTDKETFNEATDKVRTVGLVNGKAGSTIKNEEGRLSPRDYQHALCDLPAGTYKLKAFYAGNDVYVGSESDVVTLTVNKIATTLTVADITAITEGQDAVITVTATPTDENVAAVNTIATLTVTNSDKSYNKTFNVALVGGNGRYTVPNLTAGTYDVTASIGNDKYAVSTSGDAKTLTVNAGNPIVESNSVATVTVTPAISTVVKVTVGDATYYVPVVNGTGTLTLPQQVAGTYDVQAALAEDGKYLASTSDEAELVAVTGVTFSFAEGRTWMTWCDDWAWLKPEGVKAYTLSAVSGTTVTLAEVEGETIPSHTPLLLEKTGDAVTPTRIITGTEPAGYDNTTGIASTAATGFTYYGNAGDDAIAAADLDGYVFAFGNAEGKQSYILFSGDFIVVDNTTTGIAAHRCWLNVTAEATGSARQLYIVIGDKTTGVKEVRGDGEVKDNSFYSLDGRMIGIPNKGIYIYKGKKVVVK